MPNPEKTQAGYKYLLAYKITVPIYDYTVEFCHRWIDYHSRTKDQMEQAARSGMTNIPEGFKGQSLSSYIKLSGIAGGSLEELLLDYQSYARQNHMEIWGREKSDREIRELREIWKILKNNSYLPDSPNFPVLPDNPTVATNLMLTLTHQAIYLIDKLVKSLRIKHQTEGGLSEKLFRERSRFRGY